MEDGHNICYKRTTSATVILGIYAETALHDTVFIGLGITAFRRY